MKTVKHNLMVSLGLMSCLSGSGALAMESRSATLKSLAVVRSSGQTAAAHAPEVSDRLDRIYARVLQMPSARLSSAVHDAVMENQDTRSAGRQALADGVNPNAIALGAESIGCTILHQACLGMHDRPDVISALIGAGATVDSTMNNGETPLLSALSVENFEAARTLIEHGADVNVQSEFYNHTPLLYAARYGRSDLIAPILAKGADPRYRDAQGNNALMLAAAYGHIEAFKELKRLMQPTDNEIVEALSYKAKLGDKECILGCFDNNMSTALHWAVKNRYDLLARKLCEDSDDKPLLEVALSVAAQCGNDTVARMLCQRGDINLDAPDSDENGVTPLMLAAQNGHEAVVRTLCFHGAALDANRNNGLPVLFYAAQSNDEKVAQALLDHGVSLHSELRNMFPIILSAFQRLIPFSDAVQAQGFENTMLMIQQFIPGLFEAQMYQALHTAVLMNNTPMVRLLCDNGVQAAALFNTCRSCCWTGYAGHVSAQAQETYKVLASYLPFYKRMFCDPFNNAIGIGVGAGTLFSAVGLAEIAAGKWLIKNHPIAAGACAAGVGLTAGSYIASPRVREWVANHRRIHALSILASGAFCVGGAAALWGKCLLSAKNAVVSSFTGAASVVKWLRR